jgi:hypothetical protein
MGPETLPRLVQPNCTGFAPDTAEPTPLLIVAQLAVSATSSSNPTLNAVHVMLNLQWLDHPTAICMMHMNAFGK